MYIKRLVSAKLDILGMMQCLLTFGSTPKVCRILAMLNVYVMHAV